MQEENLGKKGNAIKSLYKVTKEKEVKKDKHKTKIKLLQNSRKIIKNDKKVERSNIWI